MMAVRYKRKDDDDDERRPTKSYSGQQRNPTRVARRAKTSQRTLPLSRRLSVDGNRRWPGRQMQVAASEGRKGLGIRHPLIACREPSRPRPTWEVATCIRSVKTQGRRQPQYCLGRGKPVLNCIVVNENRCSPLTSQDIYSQQVKEYSLNALIKNDPSPRTDSLLCTVHVKVRGVHAA